MKPVPAVPHLPFLTRRLSWLTALLLGTLLAAPVQAGSRAVCSVGAACSQSHHLTSAKHSSRIHRSFAAHGARPPAHPLENAQDLPPGLALQSNAAFIVDEANQQVLAERNGDQIQPIASITKLMTAVVVLQQQVPLDELVEIEDSDVDTLRHTHSLLRVGSRYTRRDLLLLALMSSENRAAAALGRSIGEDREGFIAIMNATAQQLGMTHTHFADSSGLNGANMSSARDLALLVRFAGSLPLVHAFTTTPESQVAAVGGRPYTFRNTNLLVRQGRWDVIVSKTGFINESGQCLVMQARIEGHLTTMVLLDSRGHLSRITDAQRVRKWLEAHMEAQVRVGALAPQTLQGRQPASATGAGSRHSGVGVSRAG